MWNSCPPPTPQRTTRQPEVCLHSPSGQSSSAVLLYGDGRLLGPGVSNPCQPSSDSALDDHSGAAQPLGPQPLQKSHLTGPEKDFSLPEAVLVRVWNQLRQGLSAQGLGPIWVLRPTEQKAIPAEELLVGPSGERRNRMLCSDSRISVLLRPCCIATSNKSTPSGSATSIRVKVSTQKVGTWMDNLQH